MSTTLDTILRTAAAKWGDHPAVLSPDGDLTFGELDSWATEFASAIAALAGPPGSVVALALELHPMFAPAFFGIVRSGRVAALVNPLLREDALVHVLGLVGASTVVATPDMALRLIGVRDRLPGLGTVVLTHQPDLPTPELDGLRTVADLRQEASPRSHPVDPPVDPDALAVLQFTSGTTGPAKAVRLTHRNLTTNAEQIAFAHRVSHSSILFDHLPTFHLMHLTTPVTAGATLVLWPDPDLLGSLDAAARYGATHYYSLPVRLSRMASEPALAGHRVPTLTAMLSGGSALAPNSAAVLARELGVTVAQGYGLQETSPLTHFADLDDPRPGSCGLPVPGTACRVVHVETRAPLPPGETGEVQIRGPQVMAGYLGRPDGAHLDPEGWFSTGDVGHVDADGHLYLSDRLNDTYKYDNWLVCPTEVENVLMTHPLVRDCVVLDVPDEHSGAVGVAVVVPRTPGTGEEQFSSYIAERLPYYQHLRAVRIAESIPRSPTGKVQRRQLRGQFFAHLISRPIAQTSQDPSEGKNMFILINRFTVTGDNKEFEETLEGMTAFMTSHAGFRSHKLYHSAKDPQIYVEISEWDDPSGHRQAMGSEEFKGWVGRLMKLATADPAPFTVLKDYAAAA
ncbi:AMP-binding protein [Nucisporomicrobium flavum]|uniref:AMP-binding protein n=1 Tax=Nucisporomicrobium flavum TaxID=2785915 RepID=UPI0018F443FD|nr:AMP-binding protein [Nucisporomicrobium flavum]